MNAQEKKTKSNIKLNHVLMLSQLKVKIVIWLHEKLGEVFERLIEIRKS